MKTIENVKEYWEHRALLTNSAQSTTNDVYLREIEYHVLKNLLQEFQPESVFDIGCGDARLISQLAEQFKNTQFTGGDYSNAMLNNAKNNISKLTNVNLYQFDVTKQNMNCKFDLIFTIRCLINIIDQRLQFEAIDNIMSMLSKNSYYVMVENFIEGHKNLNNIRLSYGLQEIPIRDHNLYFEREQLLDFIKTKFKIIKDVNISSSYYLATRVLYAKMCQIENVHPDYFDNHHKYSVNLPFAGEYGPIRMLCLQKMK